VSFTSLTELLFPSRCASCDWPGKSLCTECEIAWHAPIKMSSVDRLPIAWAADYSAKTSRVILSAKEDNHRPSQLILAQALDRALASAKAESWWEGERPIQLIPIPSPQRNNRTRGYFHLRKVARLMQVKVNFLELLEITRSVSDQSTLNSRQRSSNLAGAYQVRPGIRMESGGAVVIFDDLITTGSSLREAVRALKVAKISPEFAISACASRGQ